LKICLETHNRAVISRGEKQEPDDTLELQAVGPLRERREQVISELIHEFTNTITAVIGYSELALDTVEELHPGRRWMEKTCQQANQLALLLNKLIEQKTPQHKGDPQTSQCIGTGASESTRVHQSLSWIAKITGTKRRL
jgi:signal transduction histidine kinase